MSPGYEVRPRPARAAAPLLCGRPPSHLCAGSGGAGRVMRVSTHSPHIARIKSSFVRGVGIKSSFVRGVGIKSSFVRGVGGKSSFVRGVGGNSIA